MENSTKIRKITTEESKSSKGKHTFKTEVNHSLKLCSVRGKNNSKKRKIFSEKRKIFNPSVKMERKERFFLLLCLVLISLPNLFNFRTLEGTKLETNVGFWTPTKFISSSNPTYQTTISLEIHPLMLPPIPHTLVNWKT